MDAAVLDSPELLLPIYDQLTRPEKTAFTLVRPIWSRVPLLKASALNLPVKCDRHPSPLLQQILSKCHRVALLNFRMNDRRTRIKCEQQVETVVESFPRLLDNNGDGSSWSLDMAGYDPWTVIRESPWAQSTFGSFVLDPDERVYPAVATAVLRAVIIGSDVGRQLQSVTISHFVQVSPDLTTYFNPSRTPSLQQLEISRCSMPYVCQSSSVPPSPTPFGLKTFIWRKNLVSGESLSLPTFVPVLWSCSSLQCLHLLNVDISLQRNNECCLLTQLPLLEELALETGSRELDLAMLLRAIFRTQRLAAGDAAEASTAAAGPSGSSKCVRGSFPFPRLHTLFLSHFYFRPIDALDILRSTHKTVSPTARRSAAVQYQSHAALHTLGLSRARIGDGGFVALANMFPAVKELLLDLQVGGGVGGCGTAGMDVAADGELEDLLSADLDLQGDTAMNGRRRLYWSESWKVSLRRLYLSQPCANFINLHEATDSHDPPSPVPLDKKKDPKPTDKDPLPSRRFWTSPWLAPPSMLESMHVLGPQLRSFATSHRSVQGLFTPLQPATRGRLLRTPVLTVPCMLRWMDLRGAPVTDGHAVRHIALPPSLQLLQVRLEGFAAIDGLAGALKDRARAAMTDEDAVRSVLSVEIWVDMSLPDFLTEGEQSARSMATPQLAPTTPASRPAAKLRFVGWGEWTRPSPSSDEMPSSSSSDPPVDPRHAAESSIDGLLTLSAVRRIMAALVPSTADQPQEAPKDEEATKDEPSTDKEGAGVRVDLQQWWREADYVSLSSANDWLERATVGSHGDVVESRRVVVVVVP
ncbi:unnamed protein product [Vitrella brassicaformis CCMP3155]|uniref:Rhodanese domain-containing protein n=1 Tax=Vitrella brassicaformis (strain CCMP3155) TaxID=1169540 RepID=A0A0G4G3G0_VITBC|nr:unnamed protein product [Vitrella brassicaformis CCMP3155]|eukprot:CEM22796.1 unnamed protein product [Vitrella brassicaformis CCMP3155]